MTATSLDSVIFRPTSLPPEDSDPATFRIEHPQTSSPYTQTLGALPPRTTASLDKMGSESVAATEIPESSLPSPDNTISPLPLSPRPRTIRSDSSATLVIEPLIVISGNLPSFFLDSRLNVEFHTSSFPLVSTSRVDPFYVLQRSAAFEELLLSHVNDCLTSPDPYRFYVNGEATWSQISISSYQKVTLVRTQGIMHTASETITYHPVQDWRRTFKSLT